MIASLSGANRDDGWATGLESFDPRRANRRTSRSATGSTAASGAELARMELRAAFPALLRRFPGLRLATTPDRLDFRKLSLVYGVESLPVHLS